MSKPLQIMLYQYYWHKCNPFKNLMDLFMFFFKRHYLWHELHLQSSYFRLTPYFLLLRKTQFPSCSFFLYYFLFLWKLKTKNMKALDRQMRIHFLAFSPLSLGCLKWIQKYVFTSYGKNLLPGPHSSRACPLSFLALVN